MPFKDVRDLVMSVDEKLTEQMLGQLLKFMPKKEEVRNNKEVVTMTVICI